MKEIYPKPTKSLAIAKSDLKKWGYCLLEDAIPNKLNKLAIARLVEQAKAEKHLNLAYEDGSKSKKWGDFDINDSNAGVNQRVWMLPNKGKVFLDFLQNHNYMKCLENIVGNEFIVSSFSANIATRRGSYGASHRSMVDA